MLNYKHNILPNIDVEDETIHEDIHTVYGIAGRVPISRKIKVRISESRTSSFESIFEDNSTEDRFLDIWNALRGININYCVIVELHNFLNLKGFNLNPINNYENSHLRIINNNQLISLEGLQNSKFNQISIENNRNLTSLKDVHKHLSQGVVQISLNQPIKSNILGALKLPALRIIEDYLYDSSLSVNPFNKFIIKDFDNTKNAIKIINKYLLTEERDIIECQEEMIEVGLKEYAKL